MEHTYQKYSFGQSSSQVFQILRFYAFKCRPRDGLKPFRGVLPDVQLRFNYPELIIYLNN
jgi:hypothetical protein